MTPPNRIKELRTAKGWTAERVALEAGCSYTYINKVERGERGTPRLNLAHQIAYALDADVFDVFPREHVKAKRHTRGTLDGTE